MNADGTATSGDREVLLARLRDELLGRSFTVAVAESVTAGNVQGAIGTISGASEFFEGGVTVYAMRQKTRLLNVDPAHARVVSGVSERVAREMAVGVGDLFATNVGLATAGFAEPIAGSGAVRAAIAVCIRPGAPDVDRVVASEWVRPSPEATISRLGAIEAFVDAALRFLVEQLTRLPR